MPYANPSDRNAAKRRYDASPQGKAAKHRYYMEHRPERAMRINPQPLERVLRTWRTQ